MPTHVTQTGIIDLIAEAGIVAKFVLLVLLGASIACWAVIFSKWRMIQLATLENEKFLEIFWGGKNVEEILAKSDQFTHSPVAAVFKQGIKELRKVSSHDSGSIHSDKVEQIIRTLTRASTNEVASAERNLGWLASTASAAPFIGLFGTVWGIMNSFQSIGATGAANLAVVAPGISEALITTATGIGAAIPAVIGYNFFVGQVKKLAIELECFSQDFINIVQRSLGGKKGN